MLVLEHSRHLAWILYFTVVWFFCLFVGFHLLWQRETSFSVSRLEQFKLEQIRLEVVNTFLDTEWWFLYPDTLPRSIVKGRFSVPTFQLSHLVWTCPITKCNLGRTSVKSAVNSWSVSFWEPVTSRVAGGLLLMPILFKTSSEIWMIK